MAFEEDTALGACSPLQEAAIRTCQDDCVDCNEHDIRELLNMCEISGIPQEFGKAPIEYADAAAKNVDSDSASQQMMLTVVFPLHRRVVLHPRNGMLDAAACRTCRVHC